MESQKSIPKNIRVPYEHGTMCLFTGTERGRDPISFVNKKLEDSLNYER
jgi:hypothetical protein